MCTYNITDPTRGTIMQDGLRLDRFTDCNDLTNYQTQAYRYPPFKQSTHDCCRTEQCTYDFSNKNACRPVLLQGQRGPQGKYNLNVTKPQLRYYCPTIVLLLPLDGVTLPPHQLQNLLMQS